MLGMPRILEGSLVFSYERDGIHFQVRSRQCLDADIGVQFSDPDLEPLAGCEPFRGDDGSFTVVSEIRGGRGAFVVPYGACVAPLGIGCTACILLIEDASAEDRAMVKVLGMMLFADILLPRIGPSPASEANADAWQLLGVHSGATEREIKRAYHARLQEVHPDRNGKAAATLREAANRRTVEVIAAFEAVMKDFAEGVCPSEPMPEAGERWCSEDGPVWPGEEEGVGA